MRRSQTAKNSITSFAPPAATESILSQFNLASDLPGLNAFIVGSSVFQLEQKLRSDLIGRLLISFYSSERNNPNWRLVGELINELLIFTIVEDIDIKFRSVQNPQQSFDLERREREVANICLFSGGTDSYSGLLVTQSALPDVEGVFCAHADQSKTIHIVNELQRRVFSRKRIDINTVHVPSIGKGGYAQLRGFLYILASASVAQKLGSKRIIVTECGPTMYQPRFSPLDSVTMTTHPFVVRIASRVANLLLGRKVAVVTPFENFTKAEVIAISPEKEFLKYTHSCISQRFGTHDGTCYGCVVRRLAAIAVRVQDVKYSKNPITDPNANAGNLYTLLGFCYEFLTNYSRMDEYEIGTIETYKKQDLFRRFALDNFGAIHLLVSANKRVVQPIRDMYQSLIQSIGKQVLEDRLKQLARPAIVPDFKKQVR